MYLMVITVQYLLMDRQVVENHTLLKANKIKKKDYYNWFLKIYFILNKRMLRKI